MTMNPYLIGSKMWADIEDRWNKGRHGTDYDNCTDYHEKKNWDTKAMKGTEKIFEVMKSYTDWFFMQDFLTATLVDKLDLYIYKVVETITSTDYVRTEHTAEQVRELIVNSFAHSGVPKIEIVNGNMNNEGILYLNHNYNGIPLDPKYTEETMRHIHRLWGRPVWLKTIVKDKDFVYKMENGKLTTKLLDKGEDGTAGEPVFYMRHKVVGTGLIDVEPNFVYLP
jgi:stage V sporulation protein R